MITLSHTHGTSKLFCQPPTRGYCYLLNNGVFEWMVVRGCVFLWGCDLFGCSVWGLLIFSMIFKFFHFLTGLNP